MKIGVVGAGTMGRGIAQVTAFNGHDVCLLDLNEALLDAAFIRIQNSLKKRVYDREVINSDSVIKKTLDRISLGREIDALLDSDFVIEAVPEDLSLKKNIFHELDQICSSKTVLASNTSSILISKLASCTRRTDMVIGMHFMNPAPIMRLLEIVRSVDRSDITLTRPKELEVSLKKIPVEVKDSPGFVSNRILMPMLNEAMFAVMEGVARNEDIDKVMKLGMNQPLGPLELADLIGLDVCLSIMDMLYEGFQDSKYRACPLLREMVAVDRLGRKTGHGFYSYS